jgi:histidine triad (HIT) family protein
VSGTNCIFCKIAAGQAPASIVYESQEVLAFKDIAPAAPVHILLIPRKHIVNVASATPEDAAVLGQLILVAGQVARDLGLTEGYRLVTNTDKHGGQSVYHLHFHLLGGRYMSWPPG